MIAALNHLLMLHVRVSAVISDWIPTPTFAPDLHSSDLAVRAYHSGFSQTTAVAETFWDHVADGLVLLGCVMIVLFTLTYGIFFKWWQRRAGRGIFFTLAAISLSLVKAVVSVYVAADYPLRDLLRVLVYVTLPVAVGYMFYALIRNWLFGPSPDISIESRGIPASHLAHTSPTSTVPVEHTTPAQPGYVPVRRRPKPTDRR